ncbi:MAG: PadR family transcriptional regulator [Thaumarchaeota archaeon]|nr:PadR family transcriptional regulator [Nitrososphaerota archaeon]
MISAPKGILKLAMLKLLSESSLSGLEIQGQIERTSPGNWRPGPGSIYFVLSELRRKEMIVELPHKGGTTRRYVISSKGRSELSKLSGEARREIRRQVELLAFYSSLVGDTSLEQSLRATSSQIGG